MSQYNLGVLNPKLLISGVFDNEWNLSNVCMVVWFRFSIETYHKRSFINLFKPKMLTRHQKTDYTVLDTENYGKTRLPHPIRPQGKKTRKKTMFMYDIIM